MSHMRFLIRRILLFLLLLGVIYSLPNCKAINGPGSEENIPSIVLSNEMVQSTSVVDEVLEHISLIKLDTKPDALIQEISKLIPLKDYIIIIDKKTFRILVFDKNGQFIRSIEHRGRGPGEYLELTDVSWSDGLLYILDVGNRKVHQYTLNDQHVSSLDLSLDFGGYMFEMNQEEYLFYRRNELFPTATGYNLIVANNQLNKILDFGSKIPEILENKALVASQIMSKNRSILYAVPPFDSLIYQVDSSGHLLPTYRIDASPEYLALNLPILKNTHLDDYDFNNELMKSGAIWSISNLLVGNDHVVFTYFQKGTPNLCVYSIDKQRTKIFTTPQLSSESIFSLFIGVNETDYYCLPQADQIDKLNKAFNENININDNPVLLKISFNDEKF